jgi:hypothetical protein
VNFNVFLNFKLVGEGKVIFHSEYQRMLTFLIHASLSRGLWYRITEKLQLQLDFISQSSSLSTFPFVGNRLKQQSQVELNKFFFIV